MIREYSAGFIIFRRWNGSVRYLFLKGQGYRLDLPKGNVEKDEDPIEAAEREVAEETGLTNLKIYPQFKKENHYWYFRSGQKVYKIVYYFLAETDTKEVKVSWEHLGYEWLAFEDAMNRIKYKSMRLLLRDMERLRSTMLKSS